MDCIFDQVLFIEDGKEKDLLDPAVYPFLYNNHGEGRQLQQPQGTRTDMAPIDPSLQAGVSYANIGRRTRTVTPDEGVPYQIEQFDFHAHEVHYEPLWATEDSARAFGATLLRDGHYIEFPYSGLVMADYTYGIWAGYQSPYLGHGRGRELLPINSTDFEYHNFPHVFFSRDPNVPLVISVARWRPYADEIALADLWVAPGDALLLPPKRMPPAPLPGQDPRSIVLDMHGNRNSAHACRYIDGKQQIRTTTILGNAATMSAPDTRPHYHEETAPTVHGRLLFK